MKNVKGFEEIEDEDELEEAIDELGLDEDI